jgi:hypothetical protein
MSDRGAPHERFKRSYFRSGRHEPARPRPVSASPRPRQRPAIEVCPECGVTRFLRERGWWDNGRVFHHYACVTDAMILLHRQRLFEMGIAGGSEAIDRVMQARRLK